MLSSIRYSRADVQAEHTMALTGSHGSLSVAVGGTQEHLGARRGGGRPCSVAEGSGDSGDRAEGLQWGKGAEGRVLGCRVEQVPQG